MQPVQTPRGAKERLAGFRNESELTELLALVSNARARSPLALTATMPPRDSSADAPVTKHQAASTPDPVAMNRNHIFTAYLKFESDMVQLSDQQSEIQKLLFGEDWSAIIDRPSTQGIYRVAEQAIANLIRLAQQRFAPSGIMLEISQTEVLEKLGMTRWHDEHHRPSRRTDINKARPGPPVDLDKIWTYLENTYGGSAGTETAHRQNAEFIVKEFNLNGQSEIKRTASSVSCYRRMYASRKEYGSEAGRYDFGYSARDWIFRLFKGLACVFEWAELDQLSIDLAPSRHRICDYDFTFKPRDRVSFPGLDLVFFKEQLEFKFSHSAAEKLMLYLGTYGQS